MYRIIEDTIAPLFGVTPEDIRDISPHNTRDVLDARHFIWFVLHEVLGYRSVVIASEYGVTKRNINHYISDFSDGLRCQPFYANNYRRILSALKEKDII